MKISKLFLNTLGLAALIPILLIGITGFIDNPILGIWIIGVAAFLSIIISVIFIIIGFKTEVRYLVLWSVALIILTPFVNIIFWFTVLRRRQKGAGGNK